jgi:hypothetical protein
MQPDLELHAEAVADGNNRNEIRAEMPSISMESSSAGGLPRCTLFR